MLAFLDRIYTKIENKNRFLSKIRFYALLRFSIRLIANVLIPIKYKLVKHTNKSNKHTDRHHVVVSLTSFPQRINRIWIVIACMIHQKRQPDKIILWLSAQQFKNKEKDLPERLLKYRSDIFEIRFVEDDIKSHKKYFYALSEFPESLIITIDDDLMYVPSLVANLIILHERYPQSIVCHRAYRVKKQAGKILEYKYWENIKTATEPVMGILQTSGGGTLFKKSMLHPQVFNKEVFTRMCFEADDLWLNLMAQMNNTTTVKSGYYSVYIPIWNWNDVKLSRRNVYEGGNDVQLKNTIAYFNLKEDALFV